MLHAFLASLLVPLLICTQDDVYNPSFSFTLGTEWSVTQLGHLSSTFSTTPWNNLCIYAHRNDTTSNLTLLAAFWLFIIDILKEHPVCELYYPTTVRMYLSFLWYGRWYTRGLGATLPVQW
jgi:hypothetical protein